MKVKIFSEPFIVVMATLSLLAPAYFIKAELNEKLQEGIVTICSLSIGAYWGFLRSNSEEKDG